MVGSFALMDCGVLRDFADKCLPERYWLQETVFHSHLLGSPQLLLDVSEWKSEARVMVGALAIKRSPADIYPGPDPLTAHVSFAAFRDHEIGRDMLNRAVEKLKSKGFQKLVFGQDLRHLFPGCPIDWTEQHTLFEEVGFKVLNDQMDLERDLADYQAPEGTLEALGESVTARTCIADDFPALAAFFETTFSGRWKHDVTEKWSLEGPQTVMGLFENGACIGFALIQNEGAQLPIGGAVFQRDLGSNWGSLGPIGVSESVRGRGLGDALLAASLLELKNRGARRTIIDWTTLEKFYGKHGFLPARRYHSMVLDLA